MFSNNYKFVSRINLICRTFSQIRIDPPQTASFQYENIQITQSPLNGTKSINNLNFSPRGFSINIGSPNSKIISQKEILDLPIFNKIIENPKFIPDEIGDDITKINEILDPLTNNKVDDRGIQAARLIIIRRKKMKKHKLKKLRKKMKFEWAKVRQRREMRKEKAFQAELIGQIKQAEQFSAQQYVEEKIRKATEVPIPRFWKGKRLPQFIIKEKLGIK